MSRVHQLPDVLTGIGNPIAPLRRNFPAPITDTCYIDMPQNGERGSGPRITCVAITRRHNLHGVCVSILYRNGYRERGCRVGLFVGRTIPLDNSRIPAGVGYAVPTDRQLTLAVTECGRGRGVGAWGGGGVTTAPVMMVAM